MSLDSIITHLSSLQFSKALGFIDRIFCGIFISDKDSQPENVSDDMEDIPLGIRILQRLQHFLKASYPKLRIESGRSIVVNDWQLLNALEAISSN